MSLMIPQYAKRQPVQTQILCFFSWFSRFTYIPPSYMLMVISNNLYGYVNTRSTEEEIEVDVCNSKARLFYVDIDV